MNAASTPSTRTTGAPARSGVTGRRRRTHGASRCLPPPSGASRTSRRACRWPASTAARAGPARASPPSSTVTRLRPMPVRTASSRTRARRSSWKSTAARVAPVDARLRSSRTSAGRRRSACRTRERRVRTPTARALSRPGATRGNTPSSGGGAGRRPEQTPPREARPKAVHGRNATRWLGDPCAIRSRAALLDPRPDPPPLRRAGSEREPHRLRRPDDRHRPAQGRGTRNPRSDELAGPHAGRDAPGDPFPRDSDSERARDAACRDRGPFLELLSAGANDERCSGSRLGGRNRRPQKLRRHDFVAFDVVLRSGSSRGRWRPPCRPRRRRGRSRTGRVPARSAMSPCRAHGRQRPRPLPRTWRRPTGSRTRSHQPGGFGATAAP